MPGRQHSSPAGAPVEQVKLAIEGVACGPAPVRRAAAVPKSRTRNLADLFDASVAQADDGDAAWPDTLRRLSSEQIEHHVIAVDEDLVGHEIFGLFLEQRT